MLAENVTQSLADNPTAYDVGTNVTFSKSGSETDAHTGKPVPDSLCFEYRDRDTRFVLTYSREHTLVSQTLVDFAAGVQKIIAEIIRYPGGYLRFSGPVVLERHEGDEVTERYEEHGSFEECYWQRTIHGDR